LIQNTLKNRTNQGVFTSWLKGLFSHSRKTFISKT